LIVAACPTYAVALHNQVSDAACAELRSDCLPAQVHTDENYKRKRMREFVYLRLMLEKHGLRRMRLSTGPIYVNLDK
jgi:hypothetical protein